MIDPADFVAQGAPSVEQVRAVWEETPGASSRKVAKILQRRGFSIAFKTVHRYQSSDWKPRDPTKQTAPRKLPIPPQEAAALDRELAMIQASTTPESEPGPAPAVTDDPVLAAFKIRDAALMQLSENALLKLQAKRRIITNIHLMEAASRKAHVMILAPKETSALVGSFTDAAGAPVASGKAEGMPLPQGQPGDNATDVTPGENPPVLNGNALPNPQADTIAQFRRRLNGG